MGPLQPVFRFAPSPNGFLHLGHAYSALLNQKLAKESGGTLLLRIEDIDMARCREPLVEACLEDLQWIGFAWDGPVLRQSTQSARYRAALEGLEDRALVYPCFCSRKEIASAGNEARTRSGRAGPCDPDGVPLYPGTCRGLEASTVAQRKASGTPFAMRLDMAAVLATYGKADLSWQEARRGRMIADPSAWGDVVVGRKDIATSYHLAVVLDDALQGVTDVVRGMDLFGATSLHRLLQVALDLPELRYHHHDLIRDDGGQKLAKSRSSTPLRQLRAEGWGAQQVRNALGFG